MKTFRFVFCLVTVFVAACAHQVKPFHQVKLGMTKAQVVALLGEPSDSNFHGNQEYLTFTETDFAGNPERVKIVTIQDGKVIGLKNDDVAEQRAHEIRKAEASSTKINIGGGAAGGWHSGGFYQCSHQNVFGKYPSGGGCNTFGCWPAGGSCSAFGCSASGSCGAVNCPNKIESLPCR